MFIYVVKYCFSVADAAVYLEFVLFSFWDGLDYVCLIYRSDADAKRLHILYTLLNRD